jgi:hypothetical protein
VACGSWFLTDSYDPKREERVKRGKGGFPVCGRQFNKQRMDILTPKGFTLVSCRRRQAMIFSISCKMRRRFKPEKNPTQGHLHQLTKHYFFVK